MKLIEGIRTRWRALVDIVRDEMKGAAIGPSERGWYSILGYDAGISSSGEKVSQNTALKVAAVYACVKVLSETIASLPLILYRRNRDGGKERADDHPLYEVLHSKPNDWQTSFEWREMLMVNLGLRGNGYSEIFTNQLGRVERLEPHRADRVRPVRLKDNSIKYVIRNPEGDTRNVLQQNMLHIRNTSIDGLEGLSPITLGSECIGTAMARQKYSGAIFQSGGTKRVVLKHPHLLSDTAEKRLRQAWDSTYGGASNAGKSAVLEEGMEVVVIGMSPEDAQTVESAQYGVEDIARWYRMPPHKIGHLLRSTFSNIEHQAIEFVTDTILPWCRRIESAITRDLIAEPDLFAEFNLEGLLRGDSVARADFYQKMLDRGIYNINEVRSMENRNGIGPMGEKRFVPLNMQELTEKSMTNPKQQPPSNTSTGFPNGQDELVNILVTDIAERIAHAEIRELQKHLGKADIDIDKFKASAEAVYAGHRKYVEKALQPLIDATLLDAEQVPELIDGLFRPNRVAIQAATSSGTIHGLITSWEANRTETIREVLKDAISE